MLSLCFYTGTRCDGTGNWTMQSCVCTKCPRLRWVTLLSDLNFIHRNLISNHTKIIVE